MTPRSPVDVKQQVRVRVRIKDAVRYSPGVYEALNGKKGRIIRFNPRSFHGHPSPGPAYLVQFDQEIVPWFANGAPVSQFWFAKCDLKKLVG